MGEKPEKVVGFILEILVNLQLPPPRVALMDAMWTSKDAGGDMMKEIQTFFASLNSALEAAETEAAKEGITVAISGQDGVCGFGLGWHPIGEESSDTGAEIQAGGSAEGGPSPSQCYTVGTRSGDSDR